GNAMFRVGTRRFAPDVMVVREVGRVGPKEVEGPPDLVIEILSESTRDYDLGEKRMAYREVGIPEIWWVDLERQTVIVERRDRSYQAEAVPEGWVVSEVVPGFRIRAEWLWQEPLPSVVQCWEALRSLKSGG
ncbi:MAG: Uma2 family endonuclease, partial [Thermoflexus sp.]